MIFRSAKRANFTVIDNSVFEEKLTLPAMGLLAWLLSKPDDWSISISGCEHYLSESKNTINKYLNELEGVGFARKQRRNDGKVDWHISDTPHPKDWDKESLIPKKPHPKDCTLLNNNNKPSTKSPSGAKRISADWRPNAKSVEWVESHGVTITQAEPVIIEFIDYWTQRTTRRKDWDRSFRQNGVVQAGLLRLKRGLSETHQRSDKPKSKAEKIGDAIFGAGTEVDFLDMGKTNSEVWEPLDEPDSGPKSERNHAGGMGGEIVPLQRRQDPHGGGFLGGRVPPDTAEDFRTFEAYGSGTQDLQETPKAEGKSRDRKKIY